MSVYITTGWMLILMIMSVFVIKTYNKYSHAVTELEIARNKLSIRRLKLRPPDNYSIENINYTKELIEFIRYVTSQMVVINFTSYCNSHEMDKITRQNVLPLIPEISKYVRQSIDYEHIDFEKLLCTEEFIDKYIIKITVMFLDDALNKEIQNRIDEGRM